MKAALLFLVLALPQQGRTVGGIEAYDGYLIARDKATLTFQLIGRDIDDVWEVEERIRYYLNGRETALAKLPDRPCYVVTIWTYLGSNNWRLNQVRVIARK